jgi:hypothetical protein
MTPVSIRILALAAFASLPLLAQQPSPTPQPPTGSSPQATTPQQTNPEPGASENSNPQAVPAPSTGNSPEVSSPHLQPVTGELENKLDTKDAKTGDSVVVKTTQATTIGNGMEIPKGSEIKGHIVDVASKSAGGDNSRVTIQFDQAQLKDGQSLPIRSVIESVAPPGTATQADAAGGPSAPTTSSGGVAAGGGGMTGSQPSGANPSGSTSTPSTGSATTPSQAPAGGESAQSGAAPAPGTVVATKGNLAIKTTSIPGVLLIGDVNGRPFSNASGALLGAKQDVHLDGGTVMVVAIMTAPPTVGAAR